MGCVKMKKALIEWLAGIYFAGECYVLYCAGASCIDGQPFPKAAQIVGVVLVWGAAVAVVLAALWLFWRIMDARKPKRLGVIRMDREGRFYYDK